MTLSRGRAISISALNALLRHVNRASHAGSCKEGMCTCISSLVRLAIMPLSGIVVGGSRSISLDSDLVSQADLGGLATKTRTLGSNA